MGQGTAFVKFLLKTGLFQKKEQLEVSRQVILTYM